MVEWFNDQKEARISKEPVSNLSNFETFPPDPAGDEGNYEQLKV
jgi:hypothetical protein